MNKKTLLPIALTMLTAMVFSGSLWATTQYCKVLQNPGDAQKILESIKVCGPIILNPTQIQELQTCNNCETWLKNATKSTQENNILELDLSKKNITVYAGKNAAVFAFEQGSTTGDFAESQEFLIDDSNMTTTTGPDSTADVKNIDDWQQSGNQFPWH